MYQKLINQTPIQITLDLQEKARHSPAFDEAFQRAVAAAFATLGEPAQKVLFKSLEHDFGIPQNHVSANPETFAKALETIFGPTAAWLIELRIMQVLHSIVPDFKYATKDGELLFLDYVEALTGFL